MTNALITGITGQDGSYLAEFLLERGYHVFGLIRRSSAGPNLRNISNIVDEITLLQGDMTDSDSLKRAILECRPDEVYNLGAQSHVRVSFDVPEYTADATGMGTLRLLDAIHNTGLKTRFYQASSSEMYGKVVETPQSEKRQGW